MDLSWGTTVLEPHVIVKIYDQHYNIQKCSTDWSKRNSTKDVYQKSINLIIKGCGKTNTNPKRTRLPIAKDILKDILRTLEFVVQKRFSKLLYKAMFTVFYCALFRVGEFASPVTNCPLKPRIQQL